VPVEEAFCVIQWGDKLIYFNCYSKGTGTGQVGWFNVCFS